MKKMIIITAAASLALCLSCASEFAQGPPPPPPPGPGHSMGMRRDMFMFMGMHRYLGKVVTGAPYSAKAVTVTTQALPDGNRIDRKETSSIYRDADGRTRVERTLRMIGPWAPAGKPSEHVFIDDPVAHVAYMLNPQDKKAFKTSMASSRPRPPHPPEHRARRTHFPVKTESLGTRMIEGVKAEGQRRTFTIPAGEIGNEKPIEITSESWYSPQLQVYVLTRRDDPRFGDTTYRLTDIKLGPQAESLFQVPSDYAIENSHPRRRFRMGPPPQQPNGSGH